MSKVLNKINSSVSVVVLVYATASESMLCASNRGMWYFHLNKVSAF